MQVLVSVKVSLVRAVVAAEITLELPVATVVPHVLVEVGLLRGGEGAHVALEGADVAVSHDVSLEVAPVHGHVVTVPALGGLFGGAVLCHVTEQLLKCRSCNPASPAKQPLY